MENKLYIFKWLERYRKIKKNYQKQQILKLHKCLVLFEVVWKSIREHPFCDSNLFERVKQLVS